MADHIMAARAVLLCGGVTSLVAIALVQRVAWRPNDHLGPPLVLWLIAVGSTLTILVGLRRTDLIGGLLVSVGALLMFVTLVVCWQLLVGGRNGPPPGRDEPPLEPTPLPRCPRTRRRPLPHLRTRRARHRVPELQS